MIKKNKLPHSLNAKILYVAVLGILAGFLIYCAANWAGDIFISKVYMSDQSVSQRKAEIRSDFSNYVNQNAVSGMDTAAVARWSTEHEYVNVVVYGRDNHYLHFSAGTTHLSDSIYPYDTSEFGHPYPIRFKDGFYQVAFIDDSWIEKYQLVYITSIFAGCLTLIVLTLLYARQLSRRISNLSREAAAVGMGDLEHSIFSRGDDEISALAASMDEMRCSVIQRMGNESRAWQANTELITAISHDIRTPMTSMIGYLGLLSESDFEDKERCRQFTDSAYSKAMELKYLTDELFRYFLVFGKSELSMSMEQLDGRLLWEQLIGEAEFDLSDSGFKVKRIDLQGECTVEADPMYLMRVLNNLVSNIKKYADAERLVMVISELRDGKLSLCISNYIQPKMNRTESTKIGLMTCRKIMEFMGGSFSTLSDDDHFVAEMSIPATSKPT